VETVQSQQNYYHGSGDPIEAVGCPTESLGYANSTLDISGINQLILALTLTKKLNHF
jgi:hypothetical protein